MRFEQLYSSSTGNLYIVTASNGKRLMIECGVVWSKLQKALNYDLSNIVGCLISHEHADHSKAAKDVIAAGINVFASMGTFEALGLRGYRRTRRLVENSLVKFGKDFGVLAFDTIHDAAEPMGFIVHEIATKEYLLFATDTKFIKQRFNIKFDIIAIECSYNKEYLAKRVEYGEVNEALAIRLLNSHLEEKEAMRYISKFCSLRHCREIHLLHMSADNLHKERIKKEFENRFYIGTKVV